jgi:phospholipid transport system substrate-binding protein
VIVRRTFLMFVACSALLSVTPAAFAAAESAQDFVKAKQATLMNLLKQGKPNAEVDKVFNEVLDYRALAEAALGDHWAGRTDAEKDEFTSLLSQLVRNSYRKNLKKTLGYSIAYTGADKAHEGEVVHTVATNAKDAREEPLKIDYVVRSQGTSKRIIDVVTEGSSMVANYRSSFNRIMKKGGFQDVLQRMRKKVASGSSGAD